MKAFAFGLLAAIVSPLVWSPASAQNGTSMHTETFAQTAPFGALGFHKGAISKQNARYGSRITDLSGLGCVVLPQQSTYWFRINHSKASGPDRLGYFGVKIFGHSPQTATHTIDSLRLYRNENWIGPTGETLNPFLATRTGVRQFSALHDDTSGAPSQGRLARLEQLAGGQFHAKPDTNLPSSWEDRRIFSDREVAEIPSNEDVVLGARLFRFTSTQKKKSPDPMDFDFTPPQSMKSFIIEVSSPGSEVDQQRTRFNIELPCPITPQPQSFLSGLFWWREPANPAYSASTR